MEERMQRFLDELCQELGVTRSEYDLSAVLPEWDSMAVVSVIALIDEYFGVAIASKALSGCRTVQDLVSAIEEANKNVD